MSISVVIPAFNEEASIRRCLEALCHQLDEIDEIVVVNNNSSDRTVEIVSELQSTAHKIRLIDEPRAGLIPARNTGIEASIGDIVVRIDADTLVQPGWARSISDFYATEDPVFGAAIGPFTQYDMPLQGIHRFVMRHATNSAVGSEATVTEAPGVYGANMSIRRAVWNAIKSNTHEAAGIFEDLDISIALHAADFKIARLDGMRVEVSGRRMLTSRKSYWEFTAGIPRTWRFHGQPDKARSAWVGVWVARLLYLAFWIPVRTYDASARKHSLRNLFTKREARPIA